MNRTCILCSNCGRRWPLDINMSTYIELDIVSRPCPSCEAYTLSCTTVGDSSLHRRRDSRARGVRPGGRGCL
jgi:hypothetical protein